MFCCVLSSQIRLDCRLASLKTPGWCGWSWPWCVCVCVCVFAWVCMWVLRQGNQSVWSCFWVFRVKDKGRKSCWRLCFCFALIKHGWVFYDTHMSASRVRYSTWCGFKLKTASARTCSPPYILTRYLSALGSVGLIFTVRWCVFVYIYSWFLFPVSWTLKMIWISDHFSLTPKQNT